MMIVWNYPPDPGELPVRSFVPEGPKHAQASLDLPRQPAFLQAESKASKLQSGAHKRGWEKPRFTAQQELQFGPQKSPPFPAWPPERCANPWLAGVKHTGVEVAPELLNEAVIMRMKNGSLGAVGNFFTGEKHFCSDVAVFTHNKIRGETANSHKIGAPISCKGIRDESSLNAECFSIFQHFCACPHWVVE